MKKDTSYTQDTDTWQTIAAATARLLNRAGYELQVTNEGDTAERHGNGAGKNDAVSSGEKIPQQLLDAAPMKKQYRR